MDLDALRARVRKLSGVEMESLLSPTELDQIINEAYLHMASLADWTFLYADEEKSLDVGDRVLDLPDPVATPHSVAVVEPASHRRLLRRRRIEDFDRYPEWEAEATEGVPWAWSVRTDDTIEVFPENDDNDTVVKVRGWKRVDPLESDDDEPIFDSEFHPVVSLDAAARVLYEEGDDSGRSARYRAEVISYLMRMGRRYLVEDTELPARVYAAAFAEDSEGAPPADDVAAVPQEPR